jgi:hypothetical protein
LFFFLLFFPCFSLWPSSSVFPFFFLFFLFFMCWDFQFGVRKGFKECVSLELWFGARKEFREWMCVLWALAWSKKEIWRKNVACYKGLTTLVWNKKQNHNPTWRCLWTNKTYYKNATKLGSFSNEFFLLF